MEEQHVKPVIDGSSMLIGERRLHILALLRQNGRVLVSELSESLGISPITIRKDLEHLASQGLMERTHGGALSPQVSSISDPPLKEKEALHFKEKQRIAAAAVKLVKEGQCVLLDSGTTVTLIARALREFKSLTIITNAVNIAAELSDTNFEIILIGGTLRKNSSSLVGPLAEETIRQVRADILFLAVDGFDTKIGITTPNILESRVNRAMLNSARLAVAVCDSTKFNRSSMALIAPPSAVHTVITDDGISQADYDALKSTGVEVIRV